MSRILTNVPSLVAQRTLSQQNNSLNNTLQRLATGFRINRGADDPAGLIASENLRAEKAAINSAISNAERADQVINIAEGGLTEVSGLLTQLQGLVAGAANEAGLSVEEKEANQLQIDSILQTIDRIANATSFQGTKLLNGAFDYTTSGIDTADISEVTINAAKFAEGASLTVAATFASSAEKGLVTFSGAVTDGTLSQGVMTIEVAGNKGVQQFTFASSTAQSAIADAINAFSASTGVTASFSGNYVLFNSSEFGSSQFVSVTRVAGDTAYTFNGASSASDSGEDIGVTINGQAAQADGLVARVAGANLDLTVRFEEAFNTAGSTSFDITGGGANFQLSPSLDLAGKTSIGIQAITTGRLGSVVNGRLTELAAGGSANAVTGDLDKAQDIVGDAIKQVSKLRGRLGAFQANTIGATVRALNVSLENTSAAESQIRDTDFALETANLTRSQILVNAATNVLAISNAQPQNVLALLG